MVGGKSWEIVKTTSSFKRTKELFLHVFVGIYKHRVKDIQEPSTIPLIFHWFSLIFPNEPSWTISGIFQDPYVHNTCILTHEFAQCLCRFRGWTFIQSYKNSSGSTIRPRSAEPQRESPKYRMIYMYIYIYIRMIMDENCRILGWGMPNAALYLRYRRFRRLGDGGVQQFRGSSSRISSGAIGFCGRRSTFQREGLKMSWWTGLVDLQLSWYVVVGPR